MEENKLKNIKLGTWFKIARIDENLNIQKNSNEMNITYNYIWDVFKTLHTMGIIHLEKVGRQHKIKLTDKGLKLKTLFFEIEKIIGEDIGKT